MISKFALISLSIVLLAACAPPPAPTPPPAAPVPAPEPVSTAPIPIRSLPCSELLGANDDDRAAAAMFFIGYQASRAQVRNLTISQIEGIERKALSACALNPTMPAVRAFAVAVRTYGR